MLRNTGFMKEFTFYFSVHIMSIDEDLSFTNVLVKLPIGRWKSTYLDTDKFPKEHLSESI